jgi:hypothetical protein
VERLSEPFGPGVELDQAMSRCGPPSGRIRSLTPSRVAVRHPFPRKSPLNSMIRSHVVVDGSNIATEGRTSPSLRQLDDAVTAFLDEHPVETLTVVVDATFPNRIDPAERSEYEEAILAGELVTPPAGAIGRGDAFILQIAEKVGATVLSNDSFQELHATHPWVFDEGRLIGGKPVPGVGWVFLLRSPVRGPVSRRATRDAKDRGGRGRSADADAEPKGGRRERASSKDSGKATKAPARESAKATAKAPSAKEPTPSKGRRGRTAAKPAEPLNDPLPFIEFVAAHPVGSTLEGEVETFSSHGAYVLAGGARCYVPLKLMGDPTPTKAREVLSIGERRTFAVHSLDTPRRGIDLALVAAAPSTTRTTVATKAPSVTRSPAIDALDDDGDLPPDTVGRQTSSRRRAEAGADTTAGVDALGTTTGSHQPAEEATVTPPAKAPAKKAAAKKSAAKKTAAKKSVAKKAPAKKATAATTAAKKTVAKKVAAKKVAAKKTVAKKATATKAAAKKVATKKAVATKATAKKTVAKKVAAKKTVAKKTVATKATAKKTVAKKVAAKKTVAKKTVATKATAKKTVAKKATVKKAAATKAPAKRRAATR